MSTHTFSGSRTVRLLLVDGSQDERARFQHALSDASEFACDVVGLESGEEAVEVCRADPPDVVVLDYALRDMTGLELLAELGDEGLAPRLPVILLIAAGEEHVGVDALRLGAQEYLVKGEITAPLLSRTVRYAIERHALIADLRARDDRDAASQSQFLSHVSQQLRAPLDPIQQFLGVLRGGTTGELTAKQHEYVELISRNVRSLRDMIDQLLEAAEMDLGTLEVHTTAEALPPVIEKVAVTLLPRAVAKDVTLTWEAPPDLPAVQLDASRAEQILRTLLINAVTYTPAGGRVRVLAAPDVDSHAHVRITVADDGIGVPASRAETVFQRLGGLAADDDRRRGIGLGLYIARELTSRMNGRIWVDTTVSKGTTVHVVLPLAGVSPAQNP